MKRVLVANRGEISIRIIKTLDKLGIESIAIHHSEELGEGHWKFATKAVSLGKGTLKDTYLNISKLLEIAKENECDAVHPGYGFLSENYEFAEACQANGLVFIGPKPSVIKSMSSKSESKEIAKQANVNVLDGERVNSVEEALKLVNSFPVLIKAVAGGGGKGLKIVRKKAEFEIAFESAKREAEQYFGNGDLLIEPYVENARHIEVQLLGDNFGNIYHLFERECSIQRNYQKIIEEAPAYGLSPKTKQKLYDAAIRFAKRCEYTSAGTVEFLVKDNQFWFLEMNTRIQVEHPVTESITGIDIVEQQINIANNKPLSESFSNLKTTGHSIEARVYSESPFENFKPSVGTIEYCKFPNDIRVDSFVKTGSEITMHFDSMLAKIVAIGKTRDEAIVKLQNSLSKTHIIGVKTNLNYLLEIIDTKDFQLNSVSTTYLKENMPLLEEKHENRKARVVGANLIAPFLFTEFLLPGIEKVNLWTIAGKSFSDYSLMVFVNDEEHSINFSATHSKKFSYKIKEKNYSIEIIEFGLNETTYLVNEEPYRCIYSVGDSMNSYLLNGYNFKLKSPMILRMAKNLIIKSQESVKKSLNQILSPLFGKVISINVKEHDEVKKGQVLLTIESMKTENQILAPGEGVVDSISVKKGVQIKENIELLTLLPIN